MTAIGRQASGRPVAVTGFLCANCSRPGEAPDSGGRSRPLIPSFDWPFPVTEILVACTGRLQPEHVLKAFEHGADLIFTVSCDEDNCQYLEGSERWARRVHYVRSLLDEIGLGGERLLHFHLPGCAAQDTALGAGRPEPACSYEAAGRITAIRDEVVQAAGRIPPNPLSLGLDDAAKDSYPQEISDDDNED